MRTKGGHDVTFTEEFRDFTLLSEAEVCDFIDMFYRAAPTKWTITANTKGCKFRGEHQYQPVTRHHQITLMEKNIRKGCEKKDGAVGGNVNAPNPNVGAAMVLAHELQHANQSQTHNGHSLFYGHLGGYNKKGQPRMKHYKTRACERDARQFVDEHINEIYAYFNLPPIRHHKAAIGDDSAEIAAVADLLCECEEITMDDVRDELRHSKILNPKNVQRVLEIMRENGVTF